MNYGCFWSLSHVCVRVCLCEGYRPQSYSPSLRPTGLLYLHPSPSYGPMPPVDTLWVSGVSLSLSLCVCCGCLFVFKATGHHTPGLILFPFSTGQQGCIDGVCVWASWPCLWGLVRRSPLPPRRGTWDVCLCQRVPLAAPLDPLFSLVP